MRIAVLGRTGWLLDTARRLYQMGNHIALIATAKPASGYSVHVDDYAALARDLNCPLAVGQRELREKLALCNAEIGISANWPNVLGADITGLMPRGILNAHAGDLPRYRGNACPNWAILNDEPHIGLCVHQMAAGELDSGDVFVRRYYELRPDTYISDVYDWLDMAIPSAFCEAVQGIATGVLAGVPQSKNPADVLRTYPRRPEDAEISWREDAASIQRLIRASSRPFAGAFTRTESGGRVIIWKAAVFEHAGRWCAVPGQVMLREGDDPIVACGSGTLRLTEIELDIDVTGTAAKAEVARSLRSRLR